MNFLSFCWHSQIEDDIEQCSTQTIVVVNGIIKYHPIVIQIVMIVEGKMILYKERYETNRCVFVMKIVCCNAMYECCNIVLQLFTIY